MAEMHEGQVSGAIEKLSKDIAETKDDKFSQLVLKYLVGKCSDGAFSDCVMRECKTWEKCVKYIESEVRKSMPSKRHTGGVYVDDQTVYDIAVKYYESDLESDKSKSTVITSNSNSSGASQFVSSYRPKSKAQGSILDDIDDGDEEDADEEDEDEEGDEDEYFEDDEDDEEE